jgi:hypothetical protein
MNFYWRIIFNKFLTLKISGTHFKFDIRMLINHIFIEKIPTKTI